MDAALARRMWLLCEPIHAVTYFAPESHAAWERAGLRGFWRGYFATRAAPFGPVGPAVVEATFFNFAPSMVERALPAVWDLATPGAALEAREAGAVDALRRVLGGSVDEAAVGLVAGALREAVAAAEVAGRALFAANAALPWPDEPLAALWHATTCLREHRGDAHNAVLVAHGIDGAEAHLLAGSVAAGGADGETRRRARGWSDDEWGAAAARLRDRDLLTDDGEPTDGGRALHAAVERGTDEAARRPWEALGEHRTESAAAALTPWADAVSRSGALRFPNPMGLPPR